MKRDREDSEAFIASQADMMRVHQTRAEARLWAAIKPLGFKASEPVSLPRLKHPERVDDFILDFYHPAAKVCVEVDGGYHKDQRGPDGRRDRRLAAHGITTIRISNETVLEDLDLAIMTIKLELDLGGIL